MARSNILGIIPGYNAPVPPPVSMQVPGWDMQGDTGQEISPDTIAALQQLMGGSEIGMPDPTPPPVGAGNPGGWEAAYNQAQADAQAQYDAELSGIAQRHPLLPYNPGTLTPPSPVAMPSYNRKAEARRFNEGGGNLAPILPLLGALLGAPMTGLQAGAAVGLGARQGSQESTQRDYARTLQRSQMEQEAAQRDFAQQLAIERMKSDSVESANRIASSQANNERGAAQRAYTSRLTTAGKAAGFGAAKERADAAQKATTLRTLLGGFFSKGRYMSVQDQESLSKTINALSPEDVLPESPIMQGLSDMEREKIQQWKRSDTLKRDIEKSRQEFTAGQNAARVQAHSQLTMAVQDRIDRRSDLDRQARAANAQLSSMRGGANGAIGQQLSGLRSLTVQSDRQARQAESMIDKARSQIRQIGSSAAYADPTYQDDNPLLAGLNARGRSLVSSYLEQIKTGVGRHDDAMREYAVRVKQLQDLQTIAAQSNAQQQAPPQYLYPGQQAPLVIPGPNGTAPVVLPPPPNMRQPSAPKGGAKPRSAAASKLMSR